MITYCPAVPALAHSAHEWAIRDHSRCRELTLRKLDALIEDAELGLDPEAAR